jgi:hypothetical protein
MVFLKQNARDVTEENFLNLSILIIQVRLPKFMITVRIVI